MKKGIRAAVAPAFLASSIILAILTSLGIPPASGISDAVKPGEKRLSRFYGQSERETLLRMSLEEKIGQLLIFGFQEKSLDEDFRKWLSSGKLGNIKIFLRNVESREQVKRLADDIDELCSGASSRIPPFIATDMEGGTVNHIRYEGIPLAPAAGLIGATQNSESARIASRLVALTLSNIGVNMNFAPCADVLTEPRNRVVMTRSYSSDPEVVSGMVKAFVEEQVKLGILPVVKHFPGHGMTKFDSHVVSNRVDISKIELERVHLLPYKRLIDEKLLDGCMTAHIIFSELDPAFPATFSHEIIEGLLREDLGFDGIVVTDELEMEGAEKVSKGIVASFIQAFKAGNDLFLVGHTKSKEAKLIDEIPKLFADGTLDENELDRRVLRVLAQKKRFLRLFHELRNRPESDGDYARTVEENRKMAEEGIVLISTRVKGSIPEFMRAAVKKEKKGVILAPTSGFAGLARKYLPSWDVIDIGYHPDRDKNAKNIASAKRALKSYELALLGFANEMQGEWAEACIEEKLPFFILSIDNPFAAKVYESQAFFIAASFGPNSPGTDALLRSVFLTGDFKGRFPYDMQGR